jgi:hypothetical protein
MTQPDLILTTAKERYSDTKANGRDGKSLKQAGQQQVLDNESAEWKEKAIYLFGVYVRALLPGEKFATEDVRAFMANSDLGDPRDHHIWGALPRLALAAGFPFERTGEYRAAHSPRTHAHPVALYVRTA